MKRGCLISLLVVAALCACAFVFVVWHVLPQARMAALKEKGGRGVWIAIVSANVERERNNLPPLWPENVLQEHNFATAEEYFTYLLSDGVTLVIAEPDRRLVPDLRPELLVLNNDKAAKIGGKVTPEANIWHVVVASSNTPRDTIFLVTRNVNASDIRYAESEDEIQNPETSTRMRLAKKLFPQIRRNAVWISRGGSSLHLPEEKLFPALVCPEVRPEGAPPLKTLPAAASMRHPPIRITTPGG